MLALEEAGVVLVAGSVSAMSEALALGVTLGVSDPEGSGVGVAEDAGASGADCVAGAVAAVVVVVTGLVVTALAVVAGAVAAGAVVATLFGAPTPGATYPSDSAW